MIDLPDFADPRIMAFFASFAVVFGMAVILGGWPERLGALTLLLMPVSQLALYSTIAQPQFGSVDLVLLTSDALGLVGFALITWHADRLWTIPALAMAIISTLSHFARVNTDMLGFSYAQFTALPTAMLIALVLFGTVSRQVTLRRSGKARDWVPVTSDQRFRKILRGR